MEGADTRERIVEDNSDINEYKGRRGEGIIGKASTRPGGKWI